MSQSRKWLPSRPFSNAHWSLVVALIVLWEVLFFSDPCKVGPRFWELSCAIITVMLSLWVADKGPVPISGWRRVGELVGSLVYDLMTTSILIFMCALPISLFVPAYQCYTPRARVSEVLLAASQYKMPISERAQSQKSLNGVGKGLAVKVEGRVGGGIILPDGTIVLIGNDPPIVVVMSPSLIDGALQWKCTGLPLDFMPASCRQLPSF